MNGVLLFTGGGDIALSRFASVQLNLDVVLTDLYPRGAAINNNPYGAAVRFTKGAYLEYLAE